MPDLAAPLAIDVRRNGDWTKAQDRVTLGYEARFLRRRRLTADSGAQFVVDLPDTVSLDDGDALVLEDGRLIEVVAAPEPLTAVTGRNLARLAWHIGNRHTPCQIAPDRLVIRHDHVLEDMLRGLGAELTHFDGPFRPEGGAYGHGRTMGHDHGHAHGHGHGHGHADHTHPRPAAAAAERHHLSAADFDSGGGDGA